SDPIHPARIYGEVLKQLDRDAIVVCDGGDFASYAGKFVDVNQPGGWLDTGPYGCLGSGPGHAIAARVAHPDKQVVMFMGDGAIGPALRRAFASGVPYVVNVLADPANAYPRSSNLG